VCCAKELFVREFCLPVAKHLDAALTGLESIDVSTLTDGELHHLALGLVQEESRFAAVRARIVGAWDERRIWSTDGSRNAAMRMSRECHLNPAHAKAEVNRAKRLRTMPLTATAFAEGELSSDFVDLLRNANRAELAVLFERDEWLLVQEVQSLRYPEAKRFVDYWIDRAYTELGQERHTPGPDSSYFHVSRTFNGGADVRGHIADPIAATEFLRAFKKIEDELFEIDWQRARDEHGGTALPMHLPRTARQRSADAGVVMARRAYAFRHGRHRQPRPLVTVLVGEAAFAKTCELFDRTVISPRQLAPVLEHADVERVVFDGPSRVIDVGVRTRFFAGALRRAIEVRDRHCQHDSGCDVPAEDCQVDHKVPYAKGGLTTQENGRMACRFHNLDWQNNPDRHPTDNELDPDDERPPPDDP
jgi:hypothetical protein